MHETLEAQNCNKIVFCILYTIETLQLCFYSIRKDIPGMWKSDFLDVVRDIIQFTTLDYPMREVKYSTQQSFIAFLSIYTLTIKLLMASINSKIQKLGHRAKLNSWFNCNTKVLSIMFLLFNTIFCLPFWEIILTPMICKSNSKYNDTYKCLGGDHIILLITGMLVGIKFIIISFISCRCYYEINPFSKIPFAGPMSSQLLVKFWIKGLIVASFHYDATNQVSNYILVFIGLFYLCKQMLRIKYLVYYDITVSTYTDICDTF